MTALIALFWRDLRRAWGSGALWLPVLFFLLVATAFPFAVGPDAPLLARTGGGMIWVAALLAALLPIDRLIRPDREAGVLDQLAVRAAFSRFGTVSEDLRPPAVLARRHENGCAFGNEKPRLAARLAHIERADELDAIVRQAGDDARGGRATVRS